MRKLLSLAFLPLVAIIMFSSCGKSGDTIATVTILDGAGVPVAGALVNVVGEDSNGDNPGVIDRESTTDASGKAIFNFNDLYKRGSGGFAVLKVYASKDAMSGDGIIKVEEQKNNEGTVTIQ